MSTDHDDTDGSVTFTAEQWALLRRRLIITPYAGAAAMPAHRVTGPEMLLHWFDQAIDALELAAQRAARTEAAAVEAHRIIDAGRVWHAAMTQPAGTPVKPYARAAPPLDNRPDCGDRESLHEAIRLAVRDQGAAGASIEDIENWIGDNRSGGPVPRQVIMATLAVLHDVRRIDTPASVTWFLTAPVDCAECEGTGRNCLAHSDSAMGAAARRAEGQQ